MSRFFCLVSCFKQNSSFSSYSLHKEGSLLKRGLKIKTSHQILNSNLRVNLEIFDPWHFAECYKSGYLETGGFECWSICYLSFLLSFRHNIKFFIFLPVLALCPISRARGDWLRPPARTECHTKVSMSKPEGHLVQPLVSKQPVWLGSWYSMFHTLSLSIQTPRSAQHWESDSLRHCCWFERKEQRQPCEICFFVFCLCAFQKGKSLLFSGSTRLMTAAVLHYSTGSTQLDSYVQFGVHISIRLS